jgi:CheY-like chemotaxis protein
VAKFLYVDWDDRLSVAVRDFLLAGGHQCKTVPRGAMALDTLRSWGADIVIVEVMMPDVCGFEICRRVRADKDLFTKPVMLVSYMAADEEIQHGLAQGADDYLPKPLDSNLFSARAMSLVNSTSSVTDPDPLTGLGGHRLAKYWIQNRISARKPFALVCLELVNLVEFGQKAGLEVRNKALRHAAKIIDVCGKPLKDECFMPAHMGAGHFIAVVQPDMAEQYCQWVHKYWQEHLPEFYASAGVKVPSGGDGGRNGSSGMNALVYYMVSTTRSSNSVQECFEVLAQVRDHARTQGEGVYADRRAR